MKTLLRNRELSALLAILALFALLIALNPAWFNLQILAMIFASSQILCLLALGATLVMLTRNIDVDRRPERDCGRRRAQRRLWSDGGDCLCAGDWRTGGGL